MDVHFATQSPITCGTLLPTIHPKDRAVNRRGKCVRVCMRRAFSASDTCTLARSGHKSLGLSGNSASVAIIHESPRCRSPVRSRVRLHMIMPPSRSPRISSRRLNIVRWRLCCTCCVEATRTAVDVAACLYSERTVLSAHFILECVMCPRTSDQS